MKHKHKRIIASFFAVVLAGLMVTGCGQSSGGEQVNATLTLKEYTIQMEMGETHQIKYEVTPEGQEVLFENYDTSIISINETGMITALQAGSTTVKLTVKNTTVSKSLTVKVASNVHTVDLELGEAPTFNEDAIFIHYYRPDGTYKRWNLWLWEGGADGAQFDFNAKDSWGVIAAYPLSTWVKPMENKLGFIVRKGEWESKDYESDRYIDFSLYNQDEQGVYHIYLKSGSGNIYLDTKGNMRGKIEMATFATMNTIAVSTNLKMTSLVLKCDGEVIYSNEKTGGVTYTNFKLPNDGKIDFLKQYVVEVTLENGETISQEVSKNGLFSTKEFGDLFNYDGELGAIYTKKHTEFKVWSPFSTTIKLNIYDTGTPAALGGNDTPIQTIGMVKGEKGVFSANVEGDLEGKYYTFVVTNGSFKAKEIVDPYARSCGVNGVRGMIVDFSKTNPDGWDKIDYLPYDRKQLTIYETHVADVTSSETWTGTEANRKLFKGMYESGTTYTENGVTVTTGFDHIKELGVNAVQIIPFFDQANNEVNMTFNWGYNPLNYNALEGGYSSNPYDGYTRIKEFKGLVQAYNEAGIEIIMDVVYNHVNGAQGSNFDVLLPGYYYRYDNAGQLSNGSGCGNETASDRYMMRKFMVDSIKFWVKEYKLGGFRFDLMGLHDLETMEQLTAEAKKINPNVVIFGEPWTGGSSPLDESKSAKQINGNKYNGYGAFNDHFRDSLIMGGLKAATELGWIDKTKSAIGVEYSNKLIAGIKGTTLGPVAIEDPNKTVNYVTCHDNYTLYDRIIATKQYTDADKEVIAKMNVLANSLTFTSQGTSFMLAGEEFLRTKGGDHNSYMSSYKVNELNYALKIEHMDMFESYQKVIALKQNLDGLHLDKDGAAKLNVKMNEAGSCLSYKLNDTANGREYMIIHRNGIEGDVSFDLSGYSLYWSTTAKDAKVLSVATAIDQFETLIVYK